MSSCRRSERCGAILSADKGNKAPPEIRRSFWLHGFDFLDVELVAGDKKGIAAVTVGTLFAVGHRLIGLFAALALGDGFDVLDFQLRLL